MDTRKMVRLSLLVSLATVLGVLESQFRIPSPFPWLKLGLANIITLVALTMYGTSGAITVACVRALLVAIFVGALPMLPISFPAALISSLSMGGLRSVFGQRLSVIGLSVSGAVAHNMTQLLVVYIMVIVLPDSTLSFTRSNILFVASLLILTAVVAGSVTGLIARYLIRHLGFIDLE
ncbi:Gx transporter family protein [Candidatus Poribacteria bacterium]